MNDIALGAFNEQARATAAEHSGAFKLLQFDTTSTTNAKATAVRLLEGLLPQMRTWGEQKIVVVPRDAVREMFVVAGEGGPHRKTFLHGQAAETAWQKLQPLMSIRLRHEVERDDSVVQIVGCGIPVHGDSLFLLTRTAKDEKAAYGRSTLWKGCHVEGEVPVTIEGVSDQVKARVLEEFHLRTTLRLDLLGLAWTEEVGTESRHLGVLYQARIDDDAVAKSMQDKEFRKAGRGHVLVGKFQTPKDIIKSLPDLDLEPWSKFAVENLGLQEPS